MKKYLLGSLIALLFLALVPTSEASRLIFSNEDPEWDGGAFVLDIGNETTGGNVSLRFGDDIDAGFNFDRLADLIGVNRSLDLENNQLLNLRYENLPADPTCDASLAGRTYYNTTDNQVYVCNGVVFQAGAEVPINTIVDVARGVSNDLEASLIASGGVEGGNLGRTPLFVLNTTDGKAQITSLGAGNECVSYLTGTDFLASNAQERVFLREGEIYIFENVQGGSIINCSEGAYGFSGQVNGADESPMPLGTLGLSFTDTFFFAFRNSTNAPNDLGLIYVANGPLESLVSLRTGTGAVVDGQADVLLEPFGFHIFHTEGNIEYRLQASNPVVAGINAEMNTLDGASGRFFDSRLILPLTNDAITWPRSGFMSSLFDNAQVEFFVRDGAEGFLNSATGTGVSPGSPVDIDANLGVGTGASDADYEPNGATRFRASGLVSAFSGADSAGLEATPLWPVQSFVQRAALPLFISNRGDGGNNGIAISSIYEGTARVFEWDPVAGVANLVYTVPITRNIGGTVTPEDQNHPAAALVSPGAAEATVVMTSDFRGGYVEADVPIHVVFNSEQNENGGTTTTFRGTSGPAVVAISADDDEQATTGITPPSIRNETRADQNGLLRRRVIDGAGVDTWVVQ